MSLLGMVRPGFLDKFQPGKGNGAVATAQRFSVAYTSPGFLFSRWKERGGGVSACLAAAAVICNVLFVVAAGIIRSKFVLGVVVCCCHPIHKVQPSRASFFLNTSVFLFLLDTHPPNSNSTSNLSSTSTVVVAFSLPRHTHLSKTQFVMAAKSIHEADGKAILSYHLTRSAVIAPSPLPAPAHNAPPKLASITFPADASPAAILDGAEQLYPWLLEKGAKFVAKPDQLIKRRGKAGLLALNKEWPEARAWIEERAGKEIQVESVKGYLRTFLVEPFCPHNPEEEYYINIHSLREVSTSVNCRVCCFLFCRPLFSVSGVWT
jgi:hypothetical protein